MLFLRRNILLIILVLVFNISELVYLPFCNIDWVESRGYMYSLGDVLYSFFNQIGYAGLVPCVLLYKSSKRLESKGIILGLIFWNTWEMLQEIDFLLNLNITIFDKLESTTTDIMQIIFLNLVVLFSYYGHKKWCITHSSP